jgi:ribosomal protein L7/L12
MLFKKGEDPVIKKIKDAAAMRAEDTAIYKKKYHKVVLHSIDPNKETLESFALKMSLRLRSPLPRVKQLLKRLPCVIKTGMSITQANKLFAVLEELGGKVTIETYFLTPGENSEKHRAGVRNVIMDNGMSIVCPECEWENEAGSEYCSLCLYLFKKKRKKISASPEPGEAADSAPGPAPGRASAPKPGTAPVSAANTAAIPRRWLLLAASFAVLLLLILIIKQ